MNPSQAILRRTDRAQWTGSSFDDFDAIVQRFLLPLVDRDICLHRSSGQSFTKAWHDSRLWIVVWATPDSDLFKKERVPEMILGCPVDVDTLAFEPTGEGVAFRDPETQFCFAELTHDTLYITFQLVKDGRQNELDLFTAIMARVAMHMLDEGVVGLETNTLSEDKADVIDALTYTPSVRLNSARNSLTRATNEVERYKVEFKRTLEGGAAERVRLGTEEQIIEQLGASSDIRSEMREVFDMIMSLPHVRYLPIYDGQSLSIFSKLIVTRHRVTKKLHELGYYRLAIPPLRAKSFRWYNMSRRVNGFQDRMNHPHVYETGAACQGNLTPRLQAVLDSGDVLGAVQLGLQFARSVNVTDPAGNHLSKWPECD